MAKIPLNTAGVTDLIQSGYLHLAAAGSDGSDNSVQGNHLRWQLLNNLGNKHFPKGTLSNSGTYATSIAYNRNNDYVALYRTRYYIDRYRTAVDLINTSQSSIVNSGNTREWHYNGIIPVSAITSNTNTIIVNFPDISQYDYWAGIYDPSSSPGDFLQHYTGIIEAWVVGKLAVSVWITPDVINSNDPAFVKSESVSVPDTTDYSAKILSGRKTETSTSASQIELRGENIENIRFSYSNLYPTHLSFQCYHDYMLGVNSEEKGAGNWTKVNDFSLSTSSSVNDARLEDTDLFTINQNWPRYYGCIPSTGDFTVSVTNYLEKWNASGAGVYEAVLRYLDKSKTDVYALDALESDTLNDQAQYDISYLETLKLIALDFHFARMLGLGTIDIPDNSYTYVYAAAFKTEKDPADESQSLDTLNVFMSLPVNENTHRLPLAPVLNPVSYGLSVSNATSTPTQLSDENGYALYDDVRFINLEKSAYLYDQPPGVFYETTFDFCMADFTRPVLFGTKYKLDTENNWRTPELNSDPDFQDAANIDEVVPFPETNGPFFTHLEREEGIHEYAIYGINLFSRVSALSNTEATDETDFPVRNTLLPPSNFQVQLIQTENPRILTTQFEQDYLLFPISGPDKTLVRATFEWNEAQNIAYQAADKVDFFFCDHAPLSIRGVVTSVSPVAGNKAQVQLGSFTITSTNPSETIQPSINSGDVSRFVGSQLAAGQQLFEVESIVISGNTPVLLIKKIRQTQSQEYPIGSNQFITTESYLAPSVGDMAMLVENMANTANWSTHLIKQVNLVNFTPLHTEIVTMSDGNQQTLNYGGLYRQGNITHLTDLHTNQPTGYCYKITFPSYSLPTHSDSAVEWYKGSVRVFSDSTPAVMKKLEVWNIDSSNGDLILTVYDPANSIDPVLDLSHTSRTSVNINFHPGYRVYLYKDNTGGNNFTSSAILPATGEGSKITYMGIRAMDTTLTPDLCSTLSVPVPLMAREIVTPVAPVALNGPQYATRPDVYGKSTYTFDTQIDTTGGRVPYGLIFSRASDRMLLGTLYEQSTLDHVLENLLNLTGDDASNYEQRLLDLINGDIDTGTGTFKKYGSGTYRLPLPDNADFAIPDPNSSSPSDPLIHPFDGSYTLSDLAGTGILQAALAHVFMPLTEQPVVFAYLKSSRKTSPKKPLFRDENGQMIQPVLPSNPNYDPDEYDPFPMAVTYTDSGNTYVRFTDYTIDGAAVNVYFYYAIEFSNVNTFSPRSPVLGAVRLVNTLAPDAPQIRKVTTQLANSAEQTDTAILFEINEYLPVDGISEYRIYRSINSKDTLNVRTMSLATTIAAGDPLIDDFSDLTYPLYGEALFYRIVAVRITKDENGNELKVPSQPSNIAMTNVVDVVNPPAPRIRSVNGTTTSTELQQVILKWPTTVYNATYVLQKQAVNGSWREIYRIKSNAAMQYPPLDQSNQPDFTNYSETDVLERIDTNGDKIRHAFRVQVINSSGLLNYSEDELVLDQGAGDLLWYNSFVKYRDGNGYILNELASGEVTYQNYRQPGSIIITDITGDLPAGHNTFTSIDVLVEDDLGNSYTRTISSQTGGVTFNNNDGGLVLDNSDPNRTYTITTTLKTDGAPDGVVQRFTLAYVAGPCYDLSQLSSILKYEDDTHFIDPLVSDDVNDEVAFPVSMKFTDISNCSSIGQVLDHIEVTVEDSRGNSYTQNISPGNFVTFTNGNGGLIFDGSGDVRNFLIKAKVITNLCTDGYEFIYSLVYSFDPCTALLALQNLCIYSDANGHSINPLVNTTLSSGSSYPDSIFIYETVSSNLPSGHSFDRMEITVLDEVAGAATKIISSTSGSVTFSNGDGGLVLDNTNPHRTYQIRIKLFTDVCKDGTVSVFSVEYP